MDGWTRIKLGAAFTTVTGNTPPKSDAALFGSFMPLVKPPELVDAAVDSAEDGLSEAGARCARTVPIDSVLISCIGNLGKVGISTIPVSFNQQINAVLPNRAVALPAFIFYQALSPAFKSQLESLASGTTVRIVNKSKFNEIEIALAPLPDQRRIVEILDEAFEAIGVAKANATRSNALCLDAHSAARDAAFTKAGAHRSRVRLGDIVDRLTNGYVGPVRGVYVDEGIPYLLARHVRDNRLQFDGKTFIGEPFNQKNKKSILKSGDLLLVQSGHIGHCAVVGEEHDGHNCHAMIVITPKPTLLLGPYLAEFFYTGEMLRKIKSIRSGSTVPHLTCGEVREIMVPLPSVNDQMELVAHMSKVTADVGRLRESLSRKLGALDELKKSLLHHAFTGQLTAKKTDQLVGAVA